MADQFAVTFDGRLYELPRSCPLLLAQDVSAAPSFTLLLNSDSHNFLLIRMNNNTISIQRNGQVQYVLVLVTELVSVNITVLDEENVVVSCSPVRK